MTKVKRSTPTGPEQVEEFKRVAHKLGCDDPADEDEVMRQLAAQKRHESPADREKPKTKKPAK